MTEIEQAYKTLGLSTGASLRQVDEAYRDLRDLWDPKRLSDSPRLRAQASEKKREIEAAYGTLVEHLSRISAQKAVHSGSLRPGSTPSPDSEANQPAANLFEDAFSDRISQGRRRIPIWAIMFLVIFAGLFLSYFAMSPSRDENETRQKARQDEEESELTRAVEKVRDHYAEAKSPPPITATPEPAPAPAENSRKKPESVPPKASPRTVESKKTGSSPQEAAAAKAPRQPPRSSEPVAQPEKVETPPVDKPLLVRDELISPSDTKETEQPVSGPSDEQLEAFKILLKGSSAASRLVKGEIVTLAFAEWSVIQQTTSETWIDLVATWSSGQEVHFFWSVNSSTGGVRPLNQAARNLESSMKSP